MTGPTVSKPSPGTFAESTRRNWLVILVLVIVAAAGAVGWSLLQSPTYQATATVVVGNQTTPSSLAGTIQLPTNYTATQAELARSSSIAQAAVDKAPEAGTSTELLARSSVTASVGANLLTFTLSADTRSGAVHIANAYAQAFVDYRRAADTQATNAVLSDVADRLKPLTDELDAAQRSGTPISSASQSLYNSLIQTQQQMRTLRSFQVANTSLSSAAVGATRKAPLPWSAGVFGALSGLILGLAVAAIPRLRDRRRPAQACDNGEISDATTPSDSETGEAQYVTVAHGNALQHDD